MARSPADVLRLVVASATLAALLLVDALFGSAVVGFTADLLRGVDALGEGLVTAVVAATRLASAALLVVGLVAALLTRRWRLLGTAVLGGLTGALLAALAGRVVDAERPPLVDLADVAGPLTAEGATTDLGLAVVAAVVTAAAAWLSRRQRRLAWALVLALAACSFVAAPSSAGAAVAVASGWTAGALVLVALGAPARRPTTDAVVEGLRSVGVDVASLRPASVDARGSTPYLGATTAGAGLFVKVVGRDQRDADLLFRLYRVVVPRRRGDERPFSSLRRAVEHEALVALDARQLGVRTPPLVGLADAEPGAFVLAYEAIAGRSLDAAGPAELDDEVLDGVWEQVATLRRHRVAHRDLRLANLFLDEHGDVWLIDFGFAELAASELLLATDLAELLAATSATAGVARAVAAGRRAVGPDALRTAVGRLRPGILSRATRTALGAHPGRLDELRARSRPRRRSARPGPATPRRSSA